MISGAELNSIPELMTIFVGLLYIAFPHVSYTYKHDSARDKKGKVVRDERTKDLRVSIGSRSAAALVTAMFTSLWGCSQISGGSG